MAIRFSDVLEHMGPSDLGPLLALTAQPDIISFAGGLPAPKTFPLKELTEVAVKVREEDGAGAMQYGPSLGFLGLREAIADRMNKMYMPMGMEKVEAKNIMIVTGSQQGLDIVGRVFLNKDDVVLCAKDGCMSTYNINIMEEKQTIIALGGGGSTKIVMDDRIERVFNFKDPLEYIRRFDEILKKKDEILDILAGEKNG